MIREQLYIYCYVPKLQLKSVLIYRSESLNFLCAEPIYQEIIPRQTSMLVLRSRIDMDPVITVAQAQAPLYKSVEL